MRFARKGAFVWINFDPLYTGCVLELVSWMGGNVNICTKRYYSQIVFSLFSSSSYLSSFKTYLFSMFGACNSCATSVQQISYSFYDFKIKKLFQNVSCQISGLQLDWNIIETYLQHLQIGHFFIV